MSNHKWNKDNVCVRCGIKRERKYWRKLMAIVNHPPWEAYMSGVDWFYWNDGDSIKTINRPDCNHKIPLEED